MWKPTLGILVGATLPAAPAVRTPKSREFSTLKGRKGIEFYLRYHTGNEGCTETFGLATHVVHHGEGFNAVGIAGEILHLGGGGQLAAELRSFDEHGRQVSAAGIDGGGVARRAGTNY